MCPCNLTSAASTSHCCSLQQLDCVQCAASSLPWTAQQSLVRQPVGDLVHRGEHDAIGGRCPDDRRREALVEAPDAALCIQLLQQASKGASGSVAYPRLNIHTLLMRLTYANVRLGCCRTQDKVPLAFILADRLVTPLNHARLISSALMRVLHIITARQIHTSPVHSCSRTPREGGSP